MENQALAATVWEVEELQGLYGPFTFSERLLQKIWLRGEFDTQAAVTTDGVALRLLHPGEWNRLGGPDFLRARLKFGDREVDGDVELHLRAGDWGAHGHAQDRAYDRVVLHVVLFTPGPGERARREDGSEVPILVLLPLLLHDLEEYAAEDALEALARRSDWSAAEDLARMPPRELWAVLTGSAAGRWRQKVLFAQRRIERLGWDGACHHSALEILGYRFNRVPMLKIAARAPRARWVGGAVDIRTLFEEETSWSLQGVRPANHPRCRLGQYAAWSRARPDWTERLAVLGEQMSMAVRVEPGLATRPARRRLEIAEWRGRLSGEILAGAVGGTREDNLVCDGFLPLVAARHGRDLMGYWFHWYVGDLPPRVAVLLRSLGAVDVRRDQPACHGLGQGLLGWMLARETAPPAAPRDEARC